MEIVRPWLHATFWLHVLFIMWSHYNCFLCLWMVIQISDFFESEHLDLTFYALVSIQRVRSNLTVGLLKHTKVYLAFCMFDLCVLAGFKGSRYGKPRVHSPCGLFFWIHWRTSFPIMLFVTIIVTTIFHFHTVALWVFDWFEILKK